MNDYDLFVFFRKLLLKGIANIGIQCDVEQGYQPSSQGANSKNALYIAKPMNGQYGWTSSDFVYNEDNGNFDETSTTYLAPTFQVSSLAAVNDDLSQTGVLTSDDLAVFAVQWLQSGYAVGKMQEVGLGIERISNIRPGFFAGDSEDFLNSPTFDFKITYTKSLAFTVDKLTPPVVGNIHRV